MTTSTDAHDHTTSDAAGGLRRPVWRHWPALLGLAAATSQVVLGVDAEGVAITVAVAGSCYLAAAASGRRWMAWAGIVLGTAAAVVAETAGLPWWTGLAGYGVVLVAVGLMLRGRVVTLAEQGLAMVGFGGVAVVALAVSPRLGLGLAGLVLAAHALWDWRHWRRDDVVPRSMAEFCFLLDVPLGLTALAVAVAG